MTTQPTAGPWDSTAALASDLYNIRYIDGPKCEKIATVRHAVDMSQEEALANAKLIAAAPDLLAALKDIMLGVAGVDRQPIYEAARAAIAKASLDT